MPCMFSNFSWAVFLFLSRSSGGNGLVVGFVEGLFIFVVEFAHGGDHGIVLFLHVGHFVGYGDVGLNGFVVGLENPAHVHGGNFRGLGEAGGGKGEEQCAEESDLKIFFHKRLKFTGVADADLDAAAPAGVGIVRDGNAKLIRKGMPPPTGSTMRRPMPTLSLKMRCWPWVSLKLKGSAKTFPMS